MQQQVREIKLGRKGHGVADDPCLRITLMKDHLVRTFDVAPSTKTPGAWTVIETAERLTMRVAFSAASAQGAREFLEKRMRALIDEGWTTA